MDDAGYAFSFDDMPIYNLESSTASCACDHHSSNNKVNLINCDGLNLPNVDGSNLTNEEKMELKTLL
ncbi:hypothetical protein Pmar_PMAR028843, partial [Perkinsus marinus ATCC 50983]